MLEHAVQELQVKTRQIIKALKSFGDPQLLLHRIEALEGKQLSFRQYTMMKAEKTIPFRYRIAITIAASSTSRVNSATTITQDGYFFLDRYYFSFLPSAGGNSGHWRPTSSGNAFIAGSEAVAGADIGDVFDFFFELTDGRANRDRQERPIPSDIAFRGDGDGILGPEGDAFGPNSTITCNVTPTVALTNAGVLYVTLEGVQCLDYLKG